MTHLAHLPQLHDRRLLLRQRLGRGGAAPALAAGHVAAEEGRQLLALEGAGGRHAEGQAAGGVEGAGVEEEMGWGWVKRGGEIVIVRKR
jgi:hypothetical protein